MLIATGPLAPISDFLQILCWIILPVMVLSIAATAIHHYFRKRKNQEQALDEQDLLALANTSLEHKAAYLYFDHTGIVREYQDKLSYSNARYAALKKDYEQLEKRYGVNAYTNNPIPKLKTVAMENNIEQWTQQVDEISNDNVTDQLLLKDLVEEKQAQVVFLQSQLEQRVRKQHEAERAKEQLRHDLEQLSANLSEREAQLQDKLQEVQNKEEYITYMEGLMSELRQQNELLNAASSDNQEKSELLYRQLQDEQLKAAALEQRLTANKQLLQRLYHELAGCVEEESSPVVSLRPAYIGNVVEEY